MFCGLIASWKLECKCKRLLWIEYWYSKLFQQLWKFLNITDVSDYLRFNFKTQDFVMRFPIRQDAQLSQRDRAAGCVIVFAKSRRMELGDNSLRTL